MAKRTSRPQSSTPADAPSASADRSNMRLVTPSDEAPDTTSRSMGSEPSDEDIRLRAYQRYLERGGSHGMDLDDWIEAERELKKTDNG